MARAVDYEHIEEYAARDYPTGLAINQETDDLYVANMAALTHPEMKGQIQRIGLDDEAATDEVFGEGYFPGIAVDPTDGDLYTIDFGNEMEMIELGRAEYVWDPFGYDRKIVTYDRSGNLKPEASIPITAELTTPVRPQLAADRNGSVYYPNLATDRVEVYKRNGKLARTITGSAADGSALRNPSQVAIGPHNTVYVVDGVKMVDDGTGYLVANFSDARLQRFDADGHRVGAGPVIDGRVKSVAVRLATGRVFVGREALYEPGDPNAYYDADFHIEAFDSGVEVANFGHGYYSRSMGGPGIAVSEETGEVYVSDEGSTEVEVYARTYH